MSDLIKKYAPYLLIAVICLCVFAPLFTEGKILYGNFDRMENTVPFKLVSLRAFQEHRLPQWNPYIFCGTSYLGNGVIHFFYPFELILYFFPEQQLPMLLTLSLLLHFFFAGYFAFLFFKKIIPDRYWALLSSLCYLLSSVMMLNLKAGVRDFASFTYLPLYFYLIKTSNKRSLALNLTLLSSTIYLLLSGCILQNALYIIEFAFLYSLYEALSGSSRLPPSLPASKQRKFKNLVHRLNIPFQLTHFASIIIASGIAAIILIPLAMNSKEVCGNISSYKEFLLYSKADAIDLMRLFAHQFFGRLTNHISSINPKDLDIIKGLKVTNELHIFDNYTGFAAAIFALYAIVFRPNKKNLFWSVSIILMLLSLTGTPLTYLLYLSTGKNLMLFYRLGWLIPFCLAALFGITGASLVRTEQKERNVFFYFVLAAAIVIHWCLYNFQVHSAHMGIDQRILEMMSKSRLYCLFLSIILLFFIYLIKKNKFRRPAKIAFLIFVICDLMFMFSFEKRRDGTDFWISPPFFKSSDACEWGQRMFDANKRNIRFTIGTAGIYKLPTSRSIAFGLYNSSGYASLSPYPIARIFNYPKIPNRFNARSVWPRTPKAAALSSTYIHILNNELIPITDKILKRVELFNRYEVIPDEEAAINRIFSPEFDIFSSVILDKDPGIFIPESEPNGNAEITRDDPERLEISIISTKNCLLLLTDTYAKGWRAFIDGEEHDILKADFAFRALAVRSGRHKIEFVYRHPGLTVSILISILSLIILAIAAICSFKRPKQTA